MSLELMCLKLFEWLLLRLLWGPWNLWFGIYCTAAGGVHMNVIRPRLNLGAVGTSILVIGIDTLYHTDTTFLTYGVTVACIVLYALAALVLKIETGRDAYIFSIPP